VERVVAGVELLLIDLWGVQRISPAKFALFDGFGCVVLTSLLFTLGFAFSGSASLVVGRVKQVELLLLVGVISVLFLYLTSKAVRVFSQEVPAGERGPEWR
jgi:membrane protein DedA with SNARE-associated domain